MKREIKDSVILGLSLFSIIFGAGNIIFSTYIGAYSGTKWPLSLIFFLIGDVFLVGLGLYAFIKNDNDEDKVFNKIGDIPSKILRIFMLACLGPLIAIPRTCAVSFEMFNFNNLIIFSIIYFILVFLFSFKSTSVIDMLGKYLTPILIIFICIFLLIGVNVSKGPLVTNVSNTDSIKEGLSMGYQTLDLLCISSLSMMLFTYLKKKNYKKSQRKKILVSSSIIAIICLIIIYIGLTYIGASFGKNVNVSQGILLKEISYSVLGKNSIILNIAVLLASFTTGVGLTSAVATNYEKLTKLSYKTWVIIITFVSLFIANLGLEKIINIASPLLNIIYPIVIILIVFSILNIQNKNVYLLSIIGTFIISILKLLHNITSFPHIISKLPLYNVNLEWLVFAIIFGIVGMFIKNKERK